GAAWVLKGNAIGGGPTRIHRSDMQSAVVGRLGIGAEEAEAKFGFLLEALKYGAPPHGGIAFGIDRIAALMAGTESIRDVIAFPKTTGAQCPMTGAPSPIDDPQLRELHISVRPSQLKQPHPALLCEQRQLRSAHPGARQARVAIAAPAPGRNTTWPRPSAEPHPKMPRRCPALRRAASPKPSATCIRP